MTSSEAALIDAIISICPKLREEYLDAKETFAPEPAPAMTILYYFAWRLATRPGDVTDEQLDDILGLIEGAIYSKEGAFNDYVVLGFLEGLGNIYSADPVAGRIIDRLGPMSKAYCLDGS